MAKTTTKNTNVHQIFDDLDLFKDFCREYGYVFDERDLYSQRSYIWRQYQKLVTGKTAKNQWDYLARPTHKS